MRVRLVLFVSLLLAFVAAAAPAPSPPPTPPPVVVDQNLYQYSDTNDTFALLLLEAVNWVGDVYVRPVSRVELLYPALTALYESARRPVPRDLRQRLERAEKKSVAPSQPRAEAPAPRMPVLVPPRPTMGDDRPFLDLLRAVRADLGQREKFGGLEPLRIAEEAMLRSLDPYSGVITSKEDRHAARLDSMRDGFGLEVPEEDGERVCIRDVLLGSPAQKAGLQPGDEIVRLHDSDGRVRKIKESLPVLNGLAPLLKPQFAALAIPEPITITYRRLGVSGEQSVTLDWQRFRPESVFGATRRSDNSWNYWLDEKRKIAHLRLGNIVGSTAEELSDILAVLRSEGLRGLILDLRGCPGGALSGSYRTAELFLGEGTIATVQYRNEPEDVFRSTKEGKHNDFPMVVLINADSTGGAEMIAAALQDHHRAVVVGQRTHGKGNVQKMRSLGPVGLKVTSGVLLRPSGKPLHRFPDSKASDSWGVVPDPGHEMRISAEASRALRTWWEQQTLRPGSSSRRLPLDDPLADPQRNAAAEALTQLLDRAVQAKMD
jgi:carboxyl-terminal processing protease